MLYYYSQYTVTIAYLVYLSITVVYSGERPVNDYKFRDRQPDRLIDMAYRLVHVFKYHSRHKVRIHEMSSTIG